MVSQHCVHRDLPERYPKLPCENNGVKWEVVCHTGNSGSEYTIKLSYDGQFMIFGPVASTLAAASRRWEENKVCPGCTSLVREANKWNADCFVWLVAEGETPDHGADCFDVECDCFMW